MFEEAEDHTMASIHKNAYNILSSIYYSTNVTESFYWLHVLGLDLIPGADGYRLSNTPPFLCATLQASLAVSVLVCFLHQSQKGLLFEGYSSNVAKGT